MAENSTIEWTDHTFNPWIGCTKVGPGCDNCYAESLATARLGVAWGADAARRRTADSTWKLPLRWNRQAAKFGIRYRVFCASLADVFDNRVPGQWRTDLAELIRATPHLDWLLLTKRIGNADVMLGNMFDYDLPTNFRVGATIVNQDEWDRDVAKIAQISVLIGKARIFLSMEPLLGPVYLYRSRYSFPGVVGQVIVGGESGPNARALHIEWARALRDQCRADGVPFLFKQWGEWFPYGEIDADGHQNSITRGEKLGVWHEWPDGGGFSVRLGKKLAGRMLDGVQHDGFPT